MVVVIVGFSIFGAITEWLCHGVLISSDEVCDRRATNDCRWNGNISKFGKVDSEDRTFPGTVGTLLLIVSVDSCRCSFDRPKSFAIRNGVSKLCGMNNL